MIIPVDLAPCTGYSLCGSRQRSLWALFFAKKSVLNMRNNWLPGFSCKLSKWVPIFRSNVPKLREGCFKMRFPEFCTGSSGSTTFVRKRIQLCRTDPGFPMPGVRMTVVNKLPQTIQCCARVCVVCAYMGLCGWGEGRSGILSSVCGPSL